MKKLPIAISAHVHGLFKAHCESQGVKLYYKAEEALLQLIRKEQKERKDATNTSN